MSSPTALRVVLRRWRRNAMSIAALAAGTAAIVALIGVSYSSAERTAQRMSALDARTVGATLPAETWTQPEADLLARARSLPGVRGAGTLTLPDGGTPPVSLATPFTGRTARVGVAIATSDGLAARGAKVSQGGLPASAADGPSGHALLMGARLAAELGVGTDGSTSIIHIDGRRAAVVGLVRDDGGGVLDASVILTPESADALNLPAVGRGIVLAVEPGRADALAAALPLALHPQDPTGVALSIPPSPKALKAALLADSRAFVSGIVAVMGVGAAFIIVVTMQMAVWERRHEIGLNRALGASRVAVARSFVAESAAIGLVGAVLGACLGVIVAAGAARLQGWANVLPPLVGLAPVAATVLAALAGAIPAFMAARISPVELIRGR